NMLLNHHSGHRAQHYAVDILKLGPLGFRASGLHSADLTDYVIWNASVISPCDGLVEQAEDGYPDLVPPKADRENASGNHVILSCQGMEVELAHLRKGSVKVKAGDRLTVGDPIGAVGNSGNTSEPHLHVHAVDPATGKGIL